MEKDVREVINKAPEQEGEKTNKRKTGGRRVMMGILKEKKKS